MKRFVHPLLLLLARATEKELVQMVEYLKAEKPYRFALIIIRHPVATFVARLEILGRRSQDAVSQQPGLSQGGELLSHQSLSTSS